MESDDDNIVVAPSKPKATTRDRHGDADEDIISAGSGTRIPETPVIDPPKHTTRPTRTRRHVDREAVAPTTLSPVDRLRIRNAIQREELRSKERELRRTREERDNFGTEARIYRGEIEACRIEASASRRWMEVSWFGALLMLVCIVLYVLWCKVNSAEFEFQNKIVRKNLGLE